MVGNIRAEAKERCDARAAGCGPLEDNNGRISILWGRGTQDFAKKDSVVGSCRVFEVSLLQSEGCLALRGVCAAPKGGGTMAPTTTPAYQPGGGPLRGLVTALVAQVALLASVAEAQQPPSVNLYYTASTAAGPATSPVFYGVNSGHNIDAAWLSWAKHMGVNGMRIFGLAGERPTDWGAPRAPL